MVTSKLRLRAGSDAALAHHIARQLNSVIPEDNPDSDVQRLLPLIGSALERLRPILAAVRAFDHAEFNHFNSLQYSTFLYLLGNEQWRTGSSDALADRLFCLNRALNSIDLFYAVQMPEVFFLSHGLGAVLGNATYGERCVFFQNVTVGRVADARPVIGSNVVLYPGAVVTGNAIIGDGCVISAGTIVHGERIASNTVVRMGAGGLVVTPRKRDYAGLYFRGCD
jgi:serine O-acetyltransferase